MGMQALGRTFNWQYLMDGKYVNLKNVAGVAFLCYLGGGAGDTYTLVEAKDASGTGAQNLVTVTEYWTCTGDGSDAWTKRTQAAAATVTTAAAATQNCMVFEVQSVELSDTYKYVKVTSTGAGIVTALHTNLLVQRTPANLAAMGV
jgi:hypothetical protein